MPVLRDNYDTYLLRMPGFDAFLGLRKSTLVLSGLSATVSAKGQQ